MQRATYINLILIYKQCVLERNERFITTNKLVVFEYFYFFKIKFLHYLTHRMNIVK